MSRNTITQTSQALISGLEVAKLDPKNIKSRAEAIKIVNWLTAWIASGTEGLTIDKINAARTVFAAQSGVEENVHAKAILDKLSSLEASYTNIYESMSSSSRGVLGIIANPRLVLIEQALSGTSGSRRLAAASGENDSTVKQMNMLMHQLLDAAEKQAKASERPGMVFAETLHQLINQNSHSFSQEFLNQFKQAISERKEEAQLDRRIDAGKGSESNEAVRLDDAMRLLKLHKNEEVVIQITSGSGSLNEIYQQWNTMSRDERAQAQREGIQFLESLTNSSLSGLKEAEKIAAIQDEINGLSNKTQVFVQMKVRELQTGESLHKHEHGLNELLAKVFGEGFASKALVTAIMGFLGGSAFGSPFLGIFFTTAISLLGSLTNSADQSSLRPAPPDVEANNGNGKSSSRPLSLAP